MDVSSIRSLVYPLDGSSSSAGAHKKGLIFPTCASIIRMFLLSLQSTIEQNYG